MSTAHTSHPSTDRVLEAQTWYDEALESRGQAALIGLTAANTELLFEIASLLRSQGAQVAEPAPRLSVVPDPPQSASQSPHSGYGVPIPQTVRVQVPQGPVGVDDPQRLRALAESLRNDSPSVIPTLWLQALAYALEADRA